MILNPYASKAISGRWLWTVASALAFIVMVGRRDLSNQEALNIIQLIVTFYFVQRAYERPIGSNL